MRSLYVAPVALGRAVGMASRLRTIAVSPLLRELIVHISRVGALDRRIPTQARLVGVVLDQLAAAHDVGLALPSPRDPRARRFAELVTREPGAATSTARLAHQAGASLRTIERCFGA
jgi:transcriptional regulator GlxA family with amidase domain